MGRQRRLCDADIPRANTGSTMACDLLRLIAGFDLEISEIMG